MSYILDALKKSEKERQQGTLPDMLTVQDIVAEKPSKRMHWVYLLAAALLLNAGVFVWWLGFSHTAKTKVSQTATSENSSIVPVNKVEQAVSEVLKSPAPAQAISPDTSPDAKMIVPATGRPVSANPDTKSYRLKETLEVQDARSKLVTDHPASGSDTNKATEISAEKVKQVEGAGGIPSGPKGDLSELPDENKLYKLRELPSAIRQNLPVFSVSALLYSSNPDSRMVRINEQMMHEGQDLTAGVKLEEITRDGLIFRYQKYRFYVGAK